MKKILLLLLFLPVLLMAQEEEVPATAPTPDFSWYQLSLTAQDLFQKGKYKESVVYARTALMVAKRDSGENNDCYGTCLQNMGVMLQHAGELREALPYLESSVAHAAKYLGEAHEGYVSYLSSLGMLYREIGDLSKALATLQKAVNQLDKIEDFDEGIQAIILNNIALTSEESGLWDQARQYYKQSIEMVARTEGTESTRYGTRLNNLAALNFRTHHEQEALELYRQAYAIFYAKLGPAHSLTLTGRSNIAHLLLSLGRLEEARDELVELLPLVEKEYGKNQRLYLYSATCLGEVYNKLNEPGKALEILLPTMDAWDRFYPGRLQQTQNCGYNIAVAYEQQGQLPEMTHWLLRAFSITQSDIHQQLAQIGETEQLAAFTANMLRDCWEMTTMSTRYPDNPNLCGAGFDLQLALKGLILSNTQNLRRALRESSDTTLQTAFLDWKTLNKTIAQQYALSPDRRISNFDSLLQRAVLTEGMLVQRFDGFGETTRSLTWHDVQAKLKPGEAVLDFIHFYDVDPAKKRSTRALYTAWLLRSGDVAPKQVLLFEAKQLGNLRAIRDLYRPGGLLQTLLWQPLEEELNAAGREKIHTIYFSLSGMLHQLNFGAIPVGDVAGRSAGNTLADHFNLHLLGSSRQLLESSAAPASNRMENALVIGGVQYDADSISLAPTNTMVSTERSFYFQQYAPSDTMTNRGYFDGDWEYLPWTSREADSVAIVLQKAGIHPYKMKGANASEGTFKKIAGTVSLVHIATHGYFFPEADSSAVNGFQTAADPLVRSGLLLAGGNRIWKGESPPEGQEDGVLTAYEVAQMDLRKVELVVLSACETGRGEMNNIEGVYGLQRAFKMAGARYLLMSLWQVDDRVTQEFMSAFYANWLQRKMNIPQAYRQTQHELQQRYAQPFSPLLWAGFILLE